MKITKEHYDQLYTAIHDKWSETEINDYKTMYKRMRLTFQQLCFDLLFQLPQAFRDDWVDPVYKYANDNNVYTAIKKAIGGPLKESLTP